MWPRTVVPDALGYGIRDACQPFRGSAELRHAVRVLSYEQISRRERHWNRKRALPPCTL